MTKIAFILLCHKDPEGVIAQALRLTAVGDYVAIHFDARASAADYDRITAALAGNPQITFAARRIKCGWGEWSLVAATLSALRAAEKQFPGATHFYLMSGDCMPIKSAEHVRNRLAEEEADFIETFDFHTSGWIKTGLKEERLIYRHFVNERQNKVWFYRLMDWQKRLGLKRALPKGLNIRIGSQWWCLRRRTVEAMLEFIRRRPDVVRFFRTTWIPDETFFQTLVTELVPEHEIRSRTQTFLTFTDYGLPVTFHNDHYDLLVTQDYLFARKISPDAHQLKERLGQLYSASGHSFETTNDGRRQYEFLATRGRVGRRFAPRFWEAETSIGRDRTLLLIACKKWHVGKRLIEFARRNGLEGTEYIFQEDAATLPDLGGTQSSLAKRSRHRRSLVRMLFERWHTDRVVLCVDPSSVDTIEDFYRDRARVKLLFVDCDFTDDYLVGHARRIGLAGPQASKTALQKLLPTIRADVAFDGERLREMNLPSFFTLREGATPAERTSVLADFFGIPPERAAEYMATETLFVD